MWNGSQWEAATREPSLELCDPLRGVGWEWGGRLKREGIYIVVTDSRYCTKEINTTLWSNYPPIKKVFYVKFKKTTGLMEKSGYSADWGVTSNQTHGGGSSTTSTSETPLVSCQLCAALPPSLNNQQCPQALPNVLWDGGAKSAPVKNHWFIWLFRLLNTGSLDVKSR